MEIKYDKWPIFTHISAEPHNTTHTTNFSYDGDNKVPKTSYGSNEYDNVYDTLGRLSNSTIKTGSSQYNVNYSYLPGAMSSNIGVSYAGFVEDFGLQKTMTDGEMSGTTDQSFPLQENEYQSDECSNSPYEPFIQYKNSVSIRLKLFAAN